MAQRDKGRPSRGGGKSGTRSWGDSLGYAALVVGAGTVLSATVTPLLGRAIHWDWMAMLAPTLFAILTLALRRRWI